MGKSLTVTEFDLKFGQDNHILDVYAVFKEEKRGDILAIYSDRFDTNKDILHYASVHIKQNSLVFIDVKNKEDIVKEFTWKMLNDKESEGFKLIDISKYEKAEIVSSNELVVKSEVIAKLYNKTIPKLEEKVKIKKAKKKMMSSSSKILLTGFTLAFLTIVTFFVVNKDILLGTNIKYVCTNSYLDTEVGSTKEEIQNLTFNLNNELTSRSIITKYVFDDIDEYNNYVNLGTYYKQDPIFRKSSFRYEKDDTNKEFNIIEDVLLDEYYNGKNKKKELLEELINNNYQCVDVSE